VKAGKRLGALNYYRAKGAVWLELIRPWILPALGGGAALKYLGLSSSKALGFMVAIAVVTEGIAVLVGWLEYRSGATAEHYRMARDSDPYKYESLSLLREIRDRLPVDSQLTGRQLPVDGASTGPPIRHRRSPEA
jgi:hypothetical protein